MPLDPNPLTQYFRQPSIYLQLPSRGHFWPDGALNMPANNELPIYPMTAVDEITSRTPDALFNGVAVVRIFESCVPSIKDAWATPSIDVDALLIATRIATYGHVMDLTTVCPSCGNSQEFGVDLRNILEQFKAPDYATPLVIGDLSFYFKPISYRQMNDNNQIQFQDQKLINLLQNADMPDEQKMSELGKAMIKITEMTLTSIAQGISAIHTPTAQVSEFEFIHEFLKNCNREVFVAVRDFTINIKQMSEIKPLPVTCSECNTSYQQQFTLDMSNFFDSSS